MTSFRSCVLCVLVAAMAGCQKDATFTEQPLPLAAINWMNVVPDTGQLDMRIVDIVSNAGLFDANFRNAMMFPEGIEAGTRHIRVFMSSTDPNVAKQILVDTSFTFIQGEPYAFYVSGLARAGQAHAVIASAAPPAMGPTQFAIRLLNLAPSLGGAIPTLPDTTVHTDAFFFKQVDLLPSGAPALSNGAFGVPTVYAVLDTGVYRIVLTPTGTTGPAVMQVALPVGAVASPGVGQIAGTLIPGSVLTAVLLPRSVPGSPAPQGGAPAIKDSAETATLSTDTVTFQVGSITILTNRTDTTSAGKPKPDSVVRKTRRGASAGVNKGDLLLVTGANEPEYNGWQSVMAVADSLACNPVDTLVPSRDTKTKCFRSNDTATTFFRYRYRIAGAPTSPATGTLVYQVYLIGTADFTKPYVNYIVDKRP